MPPIRWPPSSSGVWSTSTGASGGTQIVADFLTQLGHVRSNDIVLTYPGGPVLYHSPPATYKAGRAAPAWFARLLVPSVPRYTFPLPSGVELIVQAEPSRGILDGWDAVTRLLLIAAVMLLDRQRPRALDSRAGRGAGRDRAAAG